jgi:hypothetical protein
MKNPFPITIYPRKSNCKDWFWVSVDVVGLPQYSQSRAVGSTKKTTNQNFVDE